MGFPLEGEEVWDRKASPRSGLALFCSDNAWVCIARREGGHLASNGSPEKGPVLPTVETFAEDAVVATRNDESESG